MARSGAESRTPEQFAAAMLAAFRMARVAYLMDQAGEVEYKGQTVDDLVSGYISMYEDLGVDFERAADRLEVERVMRWRRQSLVGMPYLDYLLTQEWQDVRYFALRRAGHRCQLCNFGRRLQVHHRTYENRGMETLDDVTVLCGRCHAGHHGR